MKKLKNILLINWLYFSKELIEVGDVNFLTGKNGAGKSTVIVHFKSFFWARPTRAISIRLQMKSRKEHLTVICALIWMKITPIPGGEKTSPLTSFANFRTTQRAAALLQE